MGRIVDLCGEVAAAADEGPEGLILPPEAWDRLRTDQRLGRDRARDALLRTVFALLAARAG